jgi:hypothetical protein
MIYTLKLRSWMEHEVHIKEVKETALVLKPYYDTKETFIEHHTCQGMSENEALDIFNDSPYPKVRKWLKRKGYEI